MPRPIWSGSISFGLVNVPVKLYSATSPKEVRFHMLHDKDGGRIQQKRVCSIDGEEVPWEHIVKGYEISKGRYVTITQEELAALHPKATRSIDIEDFVELCQIDPIFYETTYYLLPDRGAARPYVLLLEAMKRTGKVGVGSFVLRTKQYLASVRPMGGALALSTMLYADEIVDQSELEGLPGGRGEAAREGAAHGGAAGAVALRRVRSEEVQGYLPRGAAGAARAEGARRGDRRPGARGARRQGGEPDGRAGEEPSAARKGEAPEAGERRSRAEPGQQAAARTSRAPSRRKGAGKENRKHG